MNVAGNGYRNSADYNNSRLKFLYSTVRALYYLSAL